MNEYNANLIAGDEISSRSEIFRDSDIEFNLSSKEFFPRSNTYKCMLSVANKSNAEIFVEYQEFRLPDGVKLQQYDDISRLREAKFFRLKEISALIGEYRDRQFGKIRFPLAARLSRRWKENLSTLRLGKSHKIAAEEIQSVQHLDCVIAALGIEFTDQPASPPALGDNGVERLRRQIYLSKKEIEGLEEELKASAQIVLSPGELHTRELVLVCDRSRTNPTSYTVACEIKVIPESELKNPVKPDTTPEQHLRNIFSDKMIITQKFCSDSMSVAPSSMLLGFISSFSALVGVWLYYSQNPGILPWISSNSDDFTAYTRFIMHVVSAFFLGFFLLQIFDYVENFTERSITRKLKEFLNWRTAMFVGLIAGLLTPRLIEVLAAVVGGGAVAAAATNRTPGRPANADDAH